MNLNLKFFEPWQLLPKQNNGLPFLIKDLAMRKRTLIMKLGKKKSGKNRVYLKSERSYNQVLCTSNQHRNCHQIRRTNSNLQRGP